MEIIQFLWNKLGWLVYVYVGFGAMVFIVVCFIFYRVFKGLREKRLSD